MTKRTHTASGRKTKEEEQRWASLTVEQRMAEDPTYKAGGKTGRGFMPGKSGFAGRKRFETTLTGAMKSRLKDIHPDLHTTYAEIIGCGIVELAARMARGRKLTKELIAFIEKAGDRTEGKPVEKLVLNGNLTTDPSERVKELLARALERSTGESEQ